MELEISTDMAIKVFLETVDHLLTLDKRGNKQLCAWTNKKQYANFLKGNFEFIFKKQISSVITIYYGKDYPMLYSDYKQFMLIFREMGWIVCQKERFTSTQWINDKAYRVVTVDYPRYQCLKKMELYRIQKKNEKIEQQNKEKTKLPTSVEQMPPSEEITISRQIESTIEKTSSEKIEINATTRKANFLGKIKNSLRSS